MTDLDRIARAVANSLKSDADGWRRLSDLERRELQRAVAAGLLTLAEHLGDDAIKAAAAAMAETESSVHAGNTGPVRHAIVRHVVSAALHAVAEHVKA